MDSALTLLSKDGIYGPNNTPDLFAMGEVLFGVVRQGGQPSGTASRLKAVALILQNMTIQEGEKGNGREGGVSQEEVVKVTETAMGVMRKEWERMYGELGKRVEEAIEAGGKKIEERVRGLLETYGEGEKTAREELLSKIPKTFAKVVEEGGWEGTKGRGGTTTQREGGGDRREGPAGGQGKANKFAKRQVMIEKAPGFESWNLYELEDAAIIAKVNIALNNARKELRPNSPIARFEAVRKMPRGGVLLTADNEETAKWVKGGGRMRFLENLGCTTTIAEKGYRVAVDYVPVYTRPEDAEERRRMEERNEFAPGSIIEARWMKHPSRRRPGQQVATMQITMRRARQANRIINEGLKFDNKIGEGRRVEAIPCVCYNCQEVDAKHIAINCPNETTCLGCGGNHNHRTCDNYDPQTYYCKNCDMQGDHGPGSKDCPRYLEARARIEARVPGNGDELYEETDSESLEGEEVGDEGDQYPEKEEGEMQEVEQEETQIITTKVDKQWRKKEKKKQKRARQKAKAGAADSTTEEETDSGRDHGSESEGGRESMGGKKSGTQTRSGGGTIPLSQATLDEIMRRKSGNGDTGSWADMTESQERQIDALRAMRRIYERLRQKTNLKIWQQNLNKSLTAQLEMLHKVDPKVYDIVLVQEPHIDFLGNTRANAGWRVVYPTGHRDNPRLTRAVTFISSTISTSDWTPETIASQDVVLTRLKASTQTINVYNIYNDCKHDDSMNAVINDVWERRAGEVGDGDEGWMWAGDFNRHHPMWDDDANHHLFTRANLRAAQKLINNLIAFDLRMILPKGTPTLEALATKNRTRVDNVFCSQELEERIIRCRVKEGDRVGKTDHFPISIEIDMTITRATERPSHNFRLTDWDFFRKELGEKLDTLPRPREFRRGELDAFVQARIALESAIDDTIEKVVPKTKRVPWRKRWWTKDLENLQQRVKRAGRKVTRARRRGRGRERVEELEKRFRKERNTYTQAIKDEKKRHWEEWLEELDDKEVWIAGKMVGSGGSDGGRTRVPTLKGEGENEISTNEEKGKAFFEAFFPKRVAPRVDNEPTASRAKWRYSPTTDEEIDEAIRSLKPYKKSRPDTAPNCVFVKAREMLVPFLGPLFRATDTLAFYPADWKLTETPILRKPGRGDYTTPGAYRPIVLAHGMARILNMCKTRSLTENAERHGLLPANHFGGRAGRTTMDSVQLLVKTVFDAWRRRDVAAALFLDVKGAFPSVAIDVLLNEMRKKGIPEGHIEWVRRRNEGRRTRLVFDDFTTEEFEVDDGLDQGDAQSLILYLIYNADLPDMSNTRSKVTVLAFVDDVGVLATARSFEEAHRNIVKTMDGGTGIRKWAKSHNCSFGLEKFQLVDFSRKKEVDDEGQRVDIPRPELKLRGLTITPSRHAKFLGLILDQELRWREQNTKVVTKASYWATQLQRLAKNKGGVGHKNLRRLFIGTALPRILYGIEVFDPPRRGRARQFRSALEKKLDSIIGRVAVTIVGGMRTSPRDVAMAHADLDPAKIVIERAYARAAIRLATLPKTHPLSSHVSRVSKRGVQRFPSPMHLLMRYFDISVTAIEKIAPHLRLMWDAKRVELEATEGREETVRREEGRRAGERDIYTDGSLTEHGVAGAAVWMKRGIERGRKATRIGDADENTVYEGELMGLILGMEIACEKGLKGTIHIGLDNQAVLATIRTRRANHAQQLWKKFEGLVKQYLKKDGRNKLKLRWVPGHEGVEGNERADEAAREATERGREAEGDDRQDVDLTDEEEEVPISRAATRQRLMRGITEKRKSEWRESKRHERFKVFDSTLPSRNFGKLTNKMQRKQASIIFQLRTGHAQLKKHLHRIGKADSPTCESCGKKDETVYHFLMECKSHEVARRRHFAYLGRNSATMHRLLSDKRVTVKLFRYLNDTKRFTHNLGTFDTANTESPTNN
ncbi:hypothetical protein CVT24_009472 [Panaeolus cyanescens]|uniref:RNase H type-1 domain-containing protein n=1 Tax=Panaeolus cyanescens TaxID=181874 RepID=A0A409WRS4_9AGAR|nr:hypothetical protein CVT24_009472 [Panaeolus cyanescens]